MCNFASYIVWKNFAQEIVTTVMKDDIYAMERGKA